MEQIEVVMSSANQITVPKKLRQMLGLQAGDKLMFKFGKKDVKVVKAESDEEKIRRIFREFDRMKEEREKTMTSEQRAIAEMTKGWTVNQFHQYFDNLPETKAYIKEKYGV